RRSASPRRIPAGRSPQPDRGTGTARRLRGRRRAPSQVSMTATLAALVVTGWIVIGTAGAAVGAEEGPPPEVSGVDLLGPAPLPEGLVRSAIGEMIGRPRSRYAIRQSIERAWALGLFDDIWVEEVPVADGVRLRYHLGLRPLVRRIEWQGDAGLDLGQL